LSARKERHEKTSTDTPRRGGTAEGGSAFERLVELLGRNTPHVDVYGLRGGAPYFVASELARRLRRTVLYVAPDAEATESAAEGLAFFLGERPPVLRARSVERGEALLVSPPREQTTRAGWLDAARSGGLLVAEAAALAEKTVPRHVFDAATVRLRVGDTVSRSELVRRLTEAGYRREERVEAPGRLAVRGAIVDVFPPAAPPVRVEFWGDEIRSLRTFSPETQKSIERVEAVTVPPASEAVLVEEAVERLASYVRERARARELPARIKLALLEQLDREPRFGNVEWFIEALCGGAEGPLDYLPPSTVVVMHDAAACERALAGGAARARSVAASIEKSTGIAPTVDEITIAPEHLRRRLEELAVLYVDPLPVERRPGRERVEFLSSAVSFSHSSYGDGEAERSPFESLAHYMRKMREEGYAVHLVVHTETEREKFVRILDEHGLGDCTPLVGGLGRGFVLDEARTVYITENDVLGTRRRTLPPKPSAVPSAFITSFAELQTGDYIVHRTLGIGVFRGLEHLSVAGAEGDFIVCEYAGGDKVYVPVENMKLIQRYIGDGARPPRIDKLGGAGWRKVVRRVRKAVMVTARELVELYARRKASKGYRFSPLDEMFRRFELAFPHEETPDQEAAIEDVMRDMESDRPMDRLICGDVGFGKTEVAVRAAFKAVQDGKQVAVLVPTTLLAHQHLATFTERLRGYPVRVEMLSRFLTPAAARRVLADLEAGRVDIAIGTHMLLGSRVRFRDLGLVVVDEEQRFGVRHKEALKRLRERVDVLTLTATPIPRTLQLSLVGIRDISVINTPPEGRQAVDTVIYRFSPQVIKDAVVEELSRGGAVFFIHNRIHDIERWRRLIQRLVPEARVDVTHGRMSERTLEAAISRFIAGETDVLVTTAIVESGLDIPRANTIIINDAHTFGLADLYQLRGRVGRRSTRGRAVLLVPGEEALGDAALRRLKAVMELTELGSGFKLALSDLEIRGAGNLFGREQSGHIAEVGLEMYLEMLDEAVRRLKGEEPAEDELEPEIKWNLPCFLPESYVPESAERLLLYKRISTARSPEELRGLAEEMRDRFGPLPESAENLLSVMELKLAMKRHRIKRLEIGRGEGVIIFDDHSPHAKRFRPGGKGRILIEQGAGPSDVAAAIAALLERSSKAAAHPMEHQPEEDLR